VQAQRGRIAEAEESYRAALRLRPDDVGAHTRLVQIKRFAPGDPDLLELERLASSPALSDDERTRVGFALFKAYDDAGLVDRAFACLEEANRRKHASLGYDVTEDVEYVERIRDVFDGALLEDLGGAGCPSELPVFIVGMPRSGTTLVEQILAGHPQIHGAGELVEIPRLATAVRALNEAMTPFPEGIRALDTATLEQLGEAYAAHLRGLDPRSSRTTDKFPANFLYVGFIELMLPRARIVHCVRDAAATCFSCYSILFGGTQDYTYDQTTLGRYYRAYAALMEHWRSVLPAGRMLDVRYEDVVSNLEPVARRLVDFCGLDWDDACLEFHKVDRVVKTASLAQVREPIYARSVDRWRVYEDKLGALLAALEHDP
jgi:tetratricopeptide (TPR) repeat protein